VPYGRFRRQDDALHPLRPMVTELFARTRFVQRRSAVGSNLRIAGTRSPSSGLQGERDDFGESEIQDQTILIPFSVALLLRRLTENVTSLLFRCAGLDEVPDAAKQSGRLCINHRKDSFTQTQTLNRVAWTWADKITDRR